MGESQVLAGKQVNLARFDAALLPAFVWPAALLLLLSPGERWLEQSLLAAALGLAFILLPLPRRLAWGLILLCLPLAALWGAFAGEFALPPNAGTLGAILHTDRNEAWEWLSRRPWQGLVVLLLVLGNGYLCLFSPPGKLLPGLPRRPLAAGLLLLTLATLLHHDYWYGRQGQWTLVTSNDLARIWPASPLWLAADYGWRATPDLITLSPSDFVNPHRQAPILLGSDVADAINVVLVVGESQRADYADPARRPDLLPALAQRLQQGRLISFADVCAAATLTYYSVPALVTGAPIERISQAAHDLPSGLAYLKAAGYATGWISNQDDDVFGEAGWDTASYTQRSSLRKPDEVLLAPFADALHRYPQRLGLVLHLQGSHFDYDRRYPQSQAHLPTAGLTGMAAERAHYANSVAYGGWLLDKLLQELDKQGRPSVLLFVADHGENLRDDERQLFRHGTSPEVSRVELQVPAWLAWNKPYGERYADKLTLLRRHAEQPQTFSNLFALWLELGGVSSPATESSANPARTSFRATSRRAFLNAAAVRVDQCEDRR